MKIHCAQLVEGAQGRAGRHEAADKQPGETELLKIPSLMDSLQAIKNRLKASCACSGTRSTSRRCRGILRHHDRHVSATASAATTTSATAATAAAAAATPPPPPPRTTTTAAAIFTRACFIYGEVAAHELEALKLLDRRLGFVIRERHKPKFS